MLLDHQLRRGTAVVASLHAGCMKETRHWFRHPVVLPHRPRNRCAALRRPFADRRATRRPRHRLRLPAQRRCKAGPVVRADNLQCSSAPFRPMVSAARTGESTLAAARAYPAPLGASPPAPVRCLTMRICCRRGRPDTARTGWQALRAVNDIQALPVQDIEMSLKKRPTDTLPTRQYPATPRRWKARGRCI